tara:strand:+ start:16467 stop:16694 length:228 start_codon:yes stop_codon:yes gene_type:complete
MKINDNTLNGDIIIVKYVYKSDKSTSWIRVFIDFENYFDCVDSKDKIILSQERKSNIYGTWIQNNIIGRIDNEER